MLFFLADSSQALKLENINSTLIILFYVPTSFPQIQYFSLLKTYTHTQSIFQQVTGASTPIEFSKN